ncbi:hypothetical protein HK100_005623 [Physocladia obscura]|uniref:Uncharacterized protein n=1 Tax=Physocladia obscura TaxID=109957 RepID=A0AAD5T5W7_9FUNG|nr:hypothetical protein HK100_005623 [Physocladia obscura]
MFQSADGRTSRPLFTAIVRAHNGLIFAHGMPPTATSMPLVAMGTGLSLNQAKESALSSLGKDCYSEVILSNGYNSAQLAKSYLDKYLLDMPLSLASLFVGRCRFCARLIEEVFKAPEKPVYDHAMTLYHRLTTDICSRFMQLHETFRPIRIEENFAPLFESGIGILKTAENYVRLVEISEPIVISGFMRTSEQRSLEKLIVGRLSLLTNQPSQRGQVESCPFLCNEIKKKYDGKYVKIRIPAIGHPKFGQALSLKGTKIDSFLAQADAPFGFLDIYTGPDFMCILEILDSKGIRHFQILMLVQCKFQKRKVNMKTDIWRTTTLQGMFTQKDGKRPKTRKGEFSSLKVKIAELTISAVCGAAVLFPVQHKNSELIEMRKTAAKNNVVLFASDADFQQLFSEGELLRLNDLKQKN